MTGFVLALSGAIGAGKTSLAERLAARLSARRVSFGIEVRRYAEEHGANKKDRAVLQQLGQALVLTQREAFVKRVLAQDIDAQAPGDMNVPLIVDGVRHIEIFMELKRQLAPRRVHLIHITTPGSTREQRIMEKDGVERRVVARYDNDITEAQVSRILPQYAGLTVQGELPVDLQVQQVVQKLKEWHATADSELTAA